MRKCVPMRKARNPTVCYFAAHALCLVGDCQPADAGYVAEALYVFADAMLAERERVKVNRR